jgi:D-glycero-D-manno-heptose 1,7-bisphosphate phosphatase
MAGESPSPALFLDRDGVIVEEIGHLHAAQDVRLIDGAPEVIAAANRRGIRVVIVSNQSGIGRGLFGWADFTAVQRRMLELLAAEGAAIDAVFACPHHADAKDPWRHADHPARKPNPGMLLAAARMLPVRLDQSWIVGDRASDLAAGRNAQLAGGLHVLTGHGSASGERPTVRLLANDHRFRVILGSSIADAPRLLPLFDIDNQRPALRGD